MSKFSHRVWFEIEGEGDDGVLLYKIFPRKGEVWAVERYGWLEILSNWSEEDGVSRAVLVEVEKGGVFRRRLFEDCELVRRFSKGEMQMFSWRVAGARVVDGDEHSLKECMLKNKEENGTRFESQEAAYHQSETSYTRLKEKDTEEQAVDPTNNEGETEEEQAVDPINNEGETEETLKRFSDMVGVHATDEITLGSAGAVSLDHQQPEIHSINLKEVFQEKPVGHIENKRENGPNIGVKEVPDEIKLLLQDHDIEDMEAEAVSVVGEIATAEVGFIWEQPISRMHDSESHKPEISLNIGEIWALYDDLNGFPCSYARINKFIPSEGKVEVTQLKLHPVTSEEIRWVDEKLPMACGTFRASKSTCMKEVSVFSHRKFREEVKTTRFYRIFPRKGEIWSVYKNWDRSCTYSDLKGNSQYLQVEVLSDYTEKAGITVAALVREESEEAVFQRHSGEGFGLFKTFERNDLLRFSHCIPYFKIVGDGKESCFKMRIAHQGL